MKQINTIRHIDVTHKTDKNATQVSYHNNTMPGGTEPCPSYVTKKHKTAYRLNTLAK